MSVIVAISIFTIPGLAAKVKDPKCADVTEIKQNFTPEYLAVLDGYNSKGKLLDESYDMNGVLIEANHVKEVCGNSTDKTVANARTETKTRSTKPADSSVVALGAAAIDSANSTSKFNMKNARCKDFISLREEVQPIAAYYVAGKENAGKIKTGDIDEVFLERPIVQLVQDCTAKPEASFYSRAKTWTKAHL